MNMKITLCFFFLALSSILDRGGVEATELPQRLDQDLSLTKEEISALETFAQTGDNEPAAKLPRYYDFYVNDHKSAKFWFEKAATNGHVQSQCNLGVRLLLKREDAESCLEAQYWFKMAIANGSLKAQKALDYLGQCPALKETKNDVGAVEIDAYTDEKINAASAHGNFWYGGQPPRYDQSDELEKASAGLEACSQ